MKWLRTLAILGSLGAGCQAGFGAAPDDPGVPAHAGVPETSPTAPPGHADREEPPVPPRKYVEAAALLFNKKRYDLSAKYLAAAQAYRDRLSPQEQVVLDEYRFQLDRHLRGRTQADEVSAAAPDAAAARLTDPGVVAASTAGAPALDMSGRRPLPPPDPADVAQPPPGAAAPPALLRPTKVSAETFRGTADAKQHARWLLHQAREQLIRKQFDAAEQFAAEVRGMNVKWGYFDDTPEKVAESISKARALAAKDRLPGSAVGSGPGEGPESNVPHDRRTARAWLREARTALAANDPDKADAIVREIRSWGLRYGLLEDTPEKVAVATAESRRRAAVRNAELMVKAYVGTDTGSRGEPAVPVVTPDAVTTGLR